MAKVTFIVTNAGTPVVYESRAGESLLDLALRSGLNMQNDCGGCCSCGTCHVIVKSGAQNLSAQDSGERSVLRSEKAATPSSRLACQSQILGDVTVEIVNK